MSALGYSQSLALVAACLLAGCSPDGDPAGPAYASEWLEVHLADDMRLCARTALDLEAKAAGVRSATELAERPVVVRYGRSQVELLCRDGSRGCYNPGPREVVTGLRSFSHEYVHALQHGTRFPEGFWAEGGAQFFASVGTSAVARASVPEHVRLDPANAPTELLELDRDSLATQPWAYEVAEHFFFFLEDQFGRSALVDFHRRIRTEDAEAAFEDVFGESFIAASGRWQDDAAFEYETESLGEARPHCTSFFELPNTEVGELLCSDEATTGQHDNGLDQGMLDSRRACFTAESPMQVVIEFGDVPDNFAVSFESFHPCSGPASAEAYQNRSFGVEYHGIPIELAGCEWRVRPRTLTGSDPVEYEYTIRRL